MLQLKEALGVNMKENNRSTPRMFREIFKDDMAPK